MANAGTRISPRTIAKARRATGNKLPVQEKRTGKDGKQAQVARAEEAARAPAQRAGFPALAVPPGRPLSSPNAGGDRQEPAAELAVAALARVRGLSRKVTGMAQIGVTTSGDGGMTLSNTASTPRTKVQA